jgi:sugar phosphate isomerase/epimerase
MPGDGQIDLKAEIQILKEIGYDKTVSLELFNADWWKRDPEETLRLGLVRMKELFEA